MQTVSQLIEAMPYNGPLSRRAYQAKVRRYIIRVTGCEPIKPAYDANGDCKVCGECGRCPGWHTFGEVSAVVAANA